MAGLKDAASYFATESDATDSPSGTASDMVNCDTSSPAEEAALIQQQIANGRAEVRTDVTAEVITLGLSGRLSSEELGKLLTIRRNWEKGWIPLFSECQFLLALVEKLRVGPVS